MRLSDFDFPFDSALIAERPAEPRDHARLLSLPKKDGPCTHHRILDLPEWLREGDLLVLNYTRVIPARLSGRKVPSGGRVELLLVRDLGDGLWEAFVKGKLQPGQIVEISGGERISVVERSATRTTVRFSQPALVADLIRSAGQMPLPPYIKREPSESDREWYQTVFAKAEGAIAAPTAGLHFTAGLLRAIEARGARIVTITLHVGPGTFLPVTAERVHEHRLEPEQVELSVETAQAVNEARRRAGRVIAIGTTVVRTLEAAAGGDGTVSPLSGQTDLFIIPGYRFRVVDGLMTNFHLPRTTLLMLVSAFVGVERLRGAYEVAVRERYRFYSYGDAMIIL